MLAPAGPTLDRVETVVGTLAEPLYEYAVDFLLPGARGLPKSQAVELAAAFGRALGAPQAGVRVVRTAVAADRVRCVCVAPTGDAVQAAACLANLAPDAVLRLGRA